MIKLGLVSLISLSSFAAETIQCDTSKEFITSFNYLKDQKHFALKQNDISRIAHKVSKGCDKAARRFIRLTELLSKAGLETSDAINIALDYSQKSNALALSFETIFKESFLKNYLDLDLKTAVDLSKKLSTLEGDTVKVREDFQKIVRFCLSQKNLDLSGKKCADLAGKITSHGIKFESFIAKDFINFYEYLTDNKHTSFPSYKAINIGLSTLEYGPKAFKNFEIGYDFSISKKGLNRTKGESLKFAQEMAKRTLKVEKKEL